MAKAGKTGKKHNKQGKKISIRSRRGMGCTKAELDYARLLSDPCNAPLVPGLFPGSEGAYRQRFEYDFIPATNGTAAGTTTAYAAVWIPGSNYFFELNNSFANTALADGTAGWFVRNGNAEPGAATLNAQAGTVRCLAACAQVYHSGTEQQRSGVVSLGVIPAASVYRVIQDTQGGSATGAAVKVADLRSSCTYTCRMPQNKAEVKWFPGSGDAFNFPQQVKVANAATPVAGAASDGRNAILITASGFTAGVFPRIRLVGCYEWAASQSLTNGSVVSVLPKSAPGILDRALAFLQSQDGQWYLRQAGELAMARFTTNGVGYSRQRGVGAMRIEL